MNKTQKLAVITMIVLVSAGMMMIAAAPLLSIFATKAIAFNSLAGGVVVSCVGVFGAVVFECM